MADQIPFGGDSDLATNPEPRCPCVLLLDVSNSMAGERIANLNEGLKTYRDELMADSLARQRVEVAVVTFGGQVETIVPFTVAEHFTPPALTVSGNTPMGAAIRQAITLVNDRKRTYREHGLQYFRPWIFMITDGGPTDEWQPVTDLIKRGEADRAFTFFAVGVKEARMDILRQLGSVKPPLPLDGLKFRELFVWLSQSQRIVSSSRPGEEEGIGLGDPAALQAWLKM